MTSVRFEGDMSWWDVLAGYLSQTGPPTPTTPLLLPPTATLVSCIEYAKGTIFSGNGTHAGVVVDGMRKAHVASESYSTQPSSVECSSTSTNPPVLAVHDLTIVVCGTPTTITTSGNVATEATATTMEPMVEWVAPRCLQVVLPISVSSWRNLDWSCCWREVAAGAKAALSKTTIIKSTPSSIPTHYQLRPLCIDWSGFLILREMCRGLLSPAATTAFFAERVVYLNFRVFGLPWWLAHRDGDEATATVVRALQKGGGGGGEDYEGMDSAAMWCSLVESEALLTCRTGGGLAIFDNNALVDVCRWWRSFLCAHQSVLTPEVRLLLPMLTSPSPTMPIPIASSLPVLMPPIRDQVRVEAASQHSQWDMSMLPKELEDGLRSKHPSFHTELITQSKQPKQHSSLLPRRLVVCGVRLSSEKEPMRFVQLLRSMKGRGLQFGGGDGQVIPVLFGSQADKALAEEVYTQLDAVSDQSAIVIKSFISPAELCALYTISILNVHPCDYDAFALTITEAAACGCASAVPCDEDGVSRVGATGLLPPLEGLCVPFAAGSTGPAADGRAADQLMVFLRASSSTVGYDARTKTLEYTDEILGRQLLALTTV